MAVADMQDGHGPRAAAGAQRRELGVEAAHAAAPRGRVVGGERLGRVERGDLNRRLLGRLGRDVGRAAARDRQARRGNGGRDGRRRRVVGGCVGVLERGRRALHGGRRIGLGSRHGTSGRGTNGRGTSGHGRGRRDGRHGQQLDLRAAGGRHVGRQPRGRRGGLPRQAAAIVFQAEGPVVARHEGGPQLGLHDDRRHARRGLGAAGVPRPGCEIGPANGRNGLAVRGEHVGERAVVAAAGDEARHEGDGHAGHEQKRAGRGERDGQPRRNATGRRVIRDAHTARNARRRFETDRLQHTHQFSVPVPPDEFCQSKGKIEPLFRLGAHGERRVKHER